MKKFLMALAVCLCLGEAARAESVILVPDGYAQGDPLPVYEAVEQDFTGIAPEIFNAAPVLERSSNYNGLVTTCLYRFADGGRLTASQWNIEYEEFSLTDTRQTSDGAFTPALTLAGCVAALARQRAEQDAPEANGAAAGMTEAEARERAEGLLAAIGLESDCLRTAFPMDLPAIYAACAALTAHDRAWLLADRDESQFAPSDEGWYLVYAQWVNGLRVWQWDSWQEIALLIGATGIHSVRLDTSPYGAGEIKNTPARLLTAQEAAEKLPRAMRASPMGGKMDHIIALELIYTPVVNEAGERELIPAWYITYQDENAAKQGYDCYAIFSALDGAFISAIFRS